jgi:ABC-type transport system substrate-binding protein
VKGTTGKSGDYWRRRKNKNKTKGNIMKQLLALICGAILIVAYAQAQTNTMSSPATSSPATTSMTNTGSAKSSSGTVTDYTPGSAITIDPGTGRPVQFVIGQKVQVLGPDGKMLTDTDVKKNARVHLRLVQEGDRTVVDKINVEESR